MKHSLEIMGFASLVILGVLIFCFLCLLVFSTLPNFKWYRRWRGGRWECWYVDPCKSMIWHYIDKGELGYQVRPPCCFGTPIIEEYPYRDDA